jgi:hypothetical protein
MSGASTARTETPGIDQANERILTIAMVDRLGGRPTPVFVIA